MEYYSATVKNEIVPFCINMDRPRDDHTKWRKPDRERQIPYNMAYMWNQKTDKNELVYKTETDSKT